jgi:hypothetical protein
MSGAMSFTILNALRRTSLQRPAARFLLMRLRDGKILRRQLDQGWIKRPPGNISCRIEQPGEFFIQADQRQRETCHFERRQLAQPSAKAGPD